MKQITSFSLSDSAVTAYCESCSSDEPPDCKRIRVAAEAHPKAHWISGPLVGNLLRLLVSATRSQSVLEIGTFLGYSAAFIASSRSNVNVVSIEANSAYANDAEELLANSSLGKQIQILHADAGDWLRLYDGDAFDLVFFDSNRTNLMDYYEDLLDAVKPGGLLVMDNACLRGKALYPTKPWEVQTSQFNERIKNDARFLATILPLRDGVLLAYKVLG